MTEKWLVEAGLCPASQGAMDLNVLCKKPKMPGGKSALAAGSEGAQSEVEVIHMEASAKRPIGSPGHHYQIALLDRVHDSGRLVTHMGNQASLLEVELEKLKS
ncbi:hypothetical protein BHE74_00056572 [Ensete ventricosum]|nr:hypothetical protein BHE74_00056572 [Ensete ventricosum]